MSDRLPATTVREVLASAGDSVLELSAGSADAPVCGLAILDPDDELGGYPQELVLIIGARGREATRILRAAARRGASAVAVKADPSANVDDLRAAAEDAGIALLTVAPQVRWDQLEALVRGVVDGAAAAADEVSGDLFTLAETVATLTSGIVSIEDTGNRVLAYSRSGDEVDELRRLSILGWQGPEPYLALLREWGIFQRLRSGEDVVQVEERPELGIRRRLAVGIRAGSQHLGVIWVQEGARPLAERAEDALVGAARMAAVHLLRHRGTPGARTREDLVTGLLEGTASADLVAGRLGLDPSASAIVVAFTAALRTGDRPAHELNLVEMANVVSVHASSYRRGALVAAIGSRVYAVLPDVPSGSAEPALATLCAHVVDVSRRRAGLATRAGIGSPVPALSEVTTSRADADRVLDATARTPQRQVASIADLRAEVMLGATLDLLEDRSELRDPTVAALVAHDESHGTDLVISLLAYLDAMGDVRGAARFLHVHPNTLRHRVRRASAIGGIELADPRERLLCHLQLLLTTRHR